MIVLTLGLCKKYLYYLPIPILCLYGFYNNFIVLSENH